MFRHNFIYTLKALFRDRTLIFWTYVFPLILGTFFYLAFSNLEQSEMLDVIPIAIVENEEFENSILWNTSWEEMDHMDDPLFTIQYTLDEEEAKTLLDTGEIKGYFILRDQEPGVIVSGNGIEETVLQHAVEEMAQIQIIMQNTGTYEIAEASGIVDVSSSHLSYTMIEFYTLIAMTCMYGGLIGMTAVNQSLANMSSKGRRIAVSPMKKGSIIGSSILAGYVVQLIGIVLLFLYTIFVLQVDYGDNLLFIIALTLLGCLAGLSLGVCVAALVKAGDAVKLGIMLAISMAGSFFAGMMGITMKYVVDTNLPLLNQINPANMITDGLYALYYYDIPRRFLFNIMSLAVFSLIMTVLSISGLRRQRYDSI